RPSRSSTLAQGIPMPRDAALYRIALLISVLVVACSTQHSTTSETVVTELPESCTAYLAAYGRCVGKLGSHAEVLAQQGEARTRAALLEQAKEPDGIEHVKAHCSSA